MSKPVGLPGGRGKRYGEDANLNTRESDLLREGQVPRILEMCYANDRNSIGVVPAQSTMSLILDMLYLSPASPPSQAIDADIVGAWTAGIFAEPAYLDVGLYTLNRGQQTLHLQPNSTARMPWSFATVGNQRMRLERTLRINPVDTLNFFACRAVGNEIGIWQTPIYLGGVDIYPRGFNLLSTERLPGIIPLAQAPLSGTNEHPVFGYFSNAWSAVI